MKTLLNIEWLKVKNYTAFKVISIFFGVGIFATNYIFYYFKKNVIDKADPTGFLSSGSPFAFPKVWLTVSYYGGCILILPALLLLMLVTNEFTYRTSRQNIIDGFSRKQFIDVKLMSGAILALASTVLVFIAVLLFGFSVGGDFSFTGIENLGYFFLKAITYNFVAILISVLVRRTGFAIAIFFIYTAIENGLSLFLFGWAIGIKEDHKVDMGNMGNYLPMNASDGLLYSPFATLTKMAGNKLPADYTWLVLTLAFVYLALFFLWTKSNFIKRDL